MDARPADTERRLLGNTLVQLVAPGLRMALGLVLSATLSRYLGVSGFGAYALVFAYVAVFNGVLSDWGIGTICLREISRDARGRAALLSSAACVQLLICGISYALLLCGLVVIHYPAEVDLAVAVYGLTIFFAPIDIIALPFQAELRLLRVLGPSVAGILLNFILSIVVVITHGPLVALFGATLASLAFSYTWILRLSAAHLRGDRGSLLAHWKLLVREGWPLGLITVLSTASQQAPVLALSALSLESVGIFSAASRIPLQMMLIPLVLRTSSFPLLSRYWTSDRPAFRRLLDRLLRVTLIGAIPAAVLLCGLSHLVIGVLFGSAFDRAALPFQLLVPAAILAMPAILLGEALVAAGHQRVNLLIQAAAVPVLGVLLVGFVPRFGASGAASALLAFFALLLAGEIVAAQRCLGGTLPLRPLVAGTAGGGVGALLLFALASLGSVPATVVATALSGFVLTCSLLPLRRATVPASASVSGTRSAVGVGPAAAGVVQR